MSVCSHGRLPEFISQRKGRIWSLEVRVGCGRGGEEGEWGQLVRGGVWVCAWTCRWALGPVSLELGGSLSGRCLWLFRAHLLLEGRWGQSPRKCSAVCGQDLGFTADISSGFTELSGPGVCRSESAVSWALAGAGAATRPRVSTGKGAPRDPGVTWGDPMWRSQRVYPGCVHIFPWRVRLSLTSPTNTGLQQDKSILLICAESTCAPVLKKQHCSECLAFHLNMLPTRKY